jgi:uncharacterized protein YkwD
MTATLVAIPTLEELQKRLKPKSISFNKGISFEVNRMGLALPAPPDPAWGTLLPQFFQPLLDITNNFRASKGAGPLRLDSRLMGCGQWKSMNMAGYLYMDHNTPDPAWPGSRTVVQRFATYYAAAGGWGENIAYGFTDPQSVFDAWISAGPGEGHYDNIVNAGFVGCGFSAARASDGLIFWVQDFGTDAPVVPPDPSDHAAPSVPTGLTGVVLGSSVNLSWNPSSDNDSVRGYSVYMNGSRLGDSFTTRSSVGGLADGLYSFGVDAFDNSGNRSAQEVIKVNVGSAPPPPPPPVIRHPEGGDTWRNKNTNKLVNVRSVDPNTTRVYYTMQKTGAKTSRLMTVFESVFTFVKGK